MDAMAGSDLGFWLGNTPCATAEDKAEFLGEVARGNIVVLLV